MPPLSFSDQEMDRLIAASELLPTHLHSRVLRSVANRVGGLHHDPTTADLEKAIRDTLGFYGVAFGNKIKIGGNHQHQARHRRQAQAQMNLVRFDKQEISK